MTRVKKNNVTKSLLDHFLTTVASILILFALLSASTSFNKSNSTPFSSIPPHTSPTASHPLSPSPASSPNALQHPSCTAQPRLSPWSREESRVMGSMPCGRPRGRFPRGGIEEEKESDGVEEEEEDIELHDFFTDRINLGLLQGYPVEDQLFFF
ncbi:hypothetical protein SLA2020_432570 [Shorea laevis]